MKVSTYAVKISYVKFSKIELLKELMVFVAVFYSIMYAVSCGIKSKSRFSKPRISFPLYVLYLLSISLPHRLCIQYYTLSISIPLFLYFHLSFSTISQLLDCVNFVCKYLIMHSVEVSSPQPALHSPLANFFFLHLL